MDTLRLILIITGICVIAAIYLWDRLQNRHQSRHETIHPALRAKEGTGPYISADSGTDDDKQQEPDDLHAIRTGQGDADEVDAGAIFITRNSAIRQGDIPILHVEEPELTREDVALGIGAGAERPAAKAGVSEVIALYLAAPPGRRLAGSDIQIALAATGFRYGDMKIFHYHGSSQLLTDPPWFSLANNYEPGYFDINNMENFSTPGLSIFTRVPAPWDTVKVFNHMVDVSRQLAQRLEAGLLGPDRLPLGRETIETVIRRLRKHES
jgi:cell division protein ZipA